MSHNGYSVGRNGTGASWTGTAVSPDEFANLAYQGYSAINGDAGGTWAPTAVITIGGSGVVFTTVATQFFGITCHGTMTVEGVANLEAGGQLGSSPSDTWTFAALVQVQGGANFTGNTSFSGGSSGTHQTVTSGQYVDWTWNGNATFNKQTSIIGPVTQIGASGTDTFDAYATSTFHNPATFSGTASFDSNLVVQTTGQISCAGKAFFSGSFAASMTRVTSSGTTISSATASVILQLSADGNVTLSAGELTGQIVSIVNKGASTSVTVLGPGGVTASVLTKGGGTANPWTDLIWNGTAWEEFNAGSGA